MGQATKPQPVLMLAAAFSRYAEALDWARRRAEAAWGPVALESPPLAFRETNYYTPSMGPDLTKRFWAFERLADPEGLADWKLLSNAWEEEYAALGRHPEPRPLNVDPGYLALGKLVLASTKDFAHRIYLRQGIFAEVTLFYREHAWRHHDCTFPDYRRADYHAFLSECRRYLHTRSRPQH